jgi:phosphate-selective porin OprO/OprP
MKNIISLLFTISLVFCSSIAFAQTKNSDITYDSRFGDLPYFGFGSGLSMTSPDSAYRLNIRFRMQNRLATRLYSDGTTETEARIRRLRLRFDGFVFSPKIIYVIQLSFTPGDVGGNVAGLPPNIIRDAMIYYHPTQHWTFAFGQTKLPGNRQRVNSSGALQLVDRSIANAVFTVDRDFGFQAIYRRTKKNQFGFILKGAITSGEGRNWIESEGSYFAYTGRMELYPFGDFSKNGAYFEGDIMHEKKPKLMIGLGGSFNDNALRANGQLGELLYKPASLKSFFADIIFKYKGVALMVDYMYRGAHNTVYYDPENIILPYLGTGINTQASYCFKSNYEIVGRYTYITPSDAVNAFIDERTQYTMGLTRYLRGHNLKVQLDATYDVDYNQVSTSRLSDWEFRFQVELGI